MTSGRYERRNMYGRTVLTQSFIPPQATRILRTQPGNQYIRFLKVRLNSNSTFFSSSPLRLLHQSSIPWQALVCIFGLACTTFLLLALVVFM